MAPYGVSISTAASKSSTNHEWNGTPSLSHSASPQTKRETNPMQRQEPPASRLRGKA